MTRRDFESMPMPDLLEFIATEKAVVDRTQADLAKRQRALARAVRALKAKKRTP